MVKETKSQPGTAAKRNPPAAPKRGHRLLPRELTQRTQIRVPPADYVLWLEVAAREGYRRLDRGPDADEGSPGLLVHRVMTTWLASKAVRDAVANHTQLAAARRQREPAKLPPAARAPSFGRLNIPTSPEDVEVWTTAAVARGFMKNGAGAVGPLIRMVMNAYVHDASTHATVGAVVGEVVRAVTGRAAAGDRAVTGRAAGDRSLAKALRPMTDSGNEIVVKVGAEGGALTLYRRDRPEGGEQFYTHLNQVMLYGAVEAEDREPLPGEPISRSRPCATFEEGLVLLDESPFWAQLYPVTVAPAFAPRVLAAVEERLARLEPNADRDQRALRRWRSLCER